MRLPELRRQVLAANLELVRRGLVIQTWGNVSGFDPESGLTVIKASGVNYDAMDLSHLVVVALDGTVVEGDLRPSTDTATHLALYRAFGAQGVRGVVHTHSLYATMWAQSRRELPCLGTTHADYFCGAIPVTRPMTTQEISEAYEHNTGRVIIEAMSGRDCRSMSAVLVREHGPFVWGTSPQEAVLHSEVVEYVAHMAFCSSLMNGGACPAPMQAELADKHYQRKFGPGAYYGQ